MNEQNNLNNNSNKQSSYRDLTIEDLKKIAEQKKIVPVGNKTFKDTWVRALAEDDFIKAIERENSQELFPELKGNPEAQDYILENIVTALDQRRVDVDRLSISFNGQNIFKMRSGDVARSTVTDSQTELIKQALNDPASFKGSIKITNGRQVLLHVKDGQVLRDGLNLTKSSTKVEIKSAPADLYDKYSQGVETKGLRTTREVAVNAFTEGVGQEQVKEIIKAKDLGYQNLAATAGINSANNTLDKIVRSALAEIKNRNDREQSSRLTKSATLANKR